MTVLGVITLRQPVVIFKLTCINIYFFFVVKKKNPYKKQDRYNIY